MKTSDLRRKELAIEEMIKRVGQMLFEMDVITVLMLIAALKLALRHPDFPASARDRVGTFVELCISTIHRQSPTVADILRTDPDPEFLCGQ